MIFFAPFISITYICNLQDMFDYEVDSDEEWEEEEPGESLSDSNVSENQCFFFNFFLLHEFFLRIYCMIIKCIVIHVF